MWGESTRGRSVMRNVFPSHGVVIKQHDLSMFDIEKNKYGKLPIGYIASFFNNLLPDRHMLYLS